MNKEVKIVKNKTKKIMIVTLIFLVLSVTGLIGSIFLYLKFERIYLLVPMFIFLILLICCLLSLLGGLIFLIKNKRLEQIKYMKAKPALEWGIFYFKVLSNIENFVVKNNKLKKGDEYEGEKGKSI
ncbi:hypothetical protein [Spiroplasma litorale]|nr:hypothetical protein [Spiroplasma litorale]